MSAAWRLLVLWLPLAALAEPPPAVQSAPAPAQAVPERDGEIAVDHVDGLQALPMLPGGQALNRREHSVSYFTPSSIEEAWQFYLEHFRQRGWQLDESQSHAGSSGRQTGLRKEDAYVHLGVWRGNAFDSRHATRVDVHHGGRVEAATLPQLEPLPDSAHCFPRVCVYRTAVPYAELLQALRQRLAADDWLPRPLPEGTAASDRAVATLLWLARDDSELDVMIGPPPAEAGGSESTHVQYVLRLAPGGSSEARP